MPDLVVVKSRKPRARKEYQIASSDRGSYILKEPHQWVASPKGAYYYVNSSDKKVYAKKVK